jgi:hypothetical protein
MRIRNFLDLRELGEFQESVIKEHLFLNIISMQYSICVPNNNNDNNNVVLFIVQCAA